MRMILICLVALIAAGCGGDVDDGKLDVVATTEIAADITTRVAGPAAAVAVLVPSGSSPHDFGASAKDRARLEDADLVAAWGAGLEAGLPLDTLDPRPFEFAAGEDDPHIWMDPLAVAKRLPDLADRLAESDPGRAATYRRRARGYAGDLRTLDREIRRILARVPRERRKLVTSHDSLGHFIRRYGFEFVGAPFGLAPEAEPSAATVAGLIDRIRRERVPAVFAEETDDPQLMREIAREADVEIVDDLLIEGFGGDVASYEELLLADARRIAEALAP